MSWQYSFENAPDLLHLSDGKMNAVWRNRFLSFPKAMSPRQNARKKSRGVSAGIATKLVPANDGHLWAVWRLPIACLVLALVTAAIYSPVIHHPFVNYDDTGYVSQNPNIQAGLSARTFIWAVTTSREANWHPLTWLSHALDVQLFGLDAGAHHLTNVFIHIVNVLLLLLLLYRVTNAVGRSTLVAALFALHPLNVESVAWLAERKTVLSALFFFLALGGYGWYVLRPSWRRYLAMALLFAMGLASKPMIITLPCLLFVLDYWPLRRIQGWTTPSPAFPVEPVPWPQLIGEKVPLLLLCVASAVVTIVVQAAGNAMQPLRHLSVGVRLENAIYSYAMYIVKTVWPVHLAVLYPHPLNSLRFAQTASALVLLVVVSVFVWSQRTNRPYALVGWLWFLGTLVPMIGIVQVGLQAMADRYAYIPTIGLFLILVWGISDFVEARTTHRGAVVATGIAVLAGLSVLTSRQIAYWRSDEALWSHALQVTSDNFFANDKMGFALLEQGRPEAMDYFRAAARIWPADYVSRGEIAAGLQDQGELHKAIQEYETALQDGPDPESRARYYCNMAVIFRELGDSQRAKESFRNALNTDADEVQAMIQQLSGWAARQPAAPNYWRLGLLLDGLDHSAEAKSAYERALQLDPNFLPARAALDGLHTAEQ